MIEAIRRVIEGEPRIAYALVFGSTARGTRHAHSDVDIAIGGPETRSFDALAIGRLTSTLESASGQPVRLVTLDAAPPGLAYRAFRDGIPLLVRDEPAFRARLARAVLEYLDFKPVEDLFTRAVLRARRVDKALLAVKVAAIRDACARVRDVLPPDPGCAPRRSHGPGDRCPEPLRGPSGVHVSGDALLADEGLDVPATYGDVFRRLGDREVIPAELASRLAAASGFRNLVAHQYGALDWSRVHAIASERLGDLLEFCEELARKAD